VIAVIAAVLALMVAIPGGAYAVGSRQIDKARAAAAQGNYARALGAYDAADRILDNGPARLLFQAQAEQARAGLAQTRLQWARQEQAQGDFAPAEALLDAVVASGLPQWQAQANAALADLFLAWGQSLLTQKRFDEAISQLRRIKDYDRAGRLQPDATGLLATAYAAYAAAFTQAKPPEYPAAITWYQNLVQEFPQSPEAKEAAATLLPQTLYLQGIADAEAKIYDRARDALRRVVKDYPASPWAAKATAALSAPQALSGRLLNQDGTPVPNRLLRISTKWRIVSPHTYDDSEGQIYSTTTDGNGNFSLLVPPGQNYLVTWWDPSRQNFVTTFIGDEIPVNQVSVESLQPTTANFAIA